MTVLLWIPVACLMAALAGYLAESGNRSANDVGDVCGLGCLGSFVGVFGTSGAIVAAFFGYGVTLAVYYPDIPKLLGLPTVSISFEQFILPWHGWLLFVVSSSLLLFLVWRSSQYGAMLWRRQRNM